MEVCRTIEALRQLTAKEVRAASLGLVPTMGALHEGHLSLVRRAREENELVAVSIFVNPLQFGEGEDFEVYPRTEDDDLRLLREAGVDCVLCGEVQDLYPDGFSTSVQVRGITEVLEGAERPGHFDGVTTVVLKLFQIFEPTRAYFGEKDFQQLAVIRRMCIDLDLPIEIRPCPIVREKDGLALSSRNRYLPENARKLAPSIYRALLEAKGRFDHGMCESTALQASVRAALEPAFDVDYVAVRGSEDFRELRGKVSGGRLLVTARIGDVRLLDNLEL